MVLLASLTLKMWISSHQNPCLYEPYRLRYSKNVSVAAILKKTPNSGCHLEVF